jgi:hypothetical protein
VKTVEVAWNANASFNKIGGTDERPCGDPVRHSTTKVKYSNFWKTLISSGQNGGRLDGGPSKLKRVELSESQPSRLIANISSKSKL